MSGLVGNPEDRFSRVTVHVSCLFSVKQYEARHEEIKNVVSE